MNQIFNQIFNNYKMKDKKLIVKQPNKLQHGMKVNFKILVKFFNKTINFQSIKISNNKVYKKDII